MAIVNRHQISAELAALRGSAAEHEIDPLIVAIYLEDVLATALPDQLLEAALRSPAAVEAILDQYWTDA